jgi:hypothetical protein
VQNFDDEDRKWIIVTLSSDRPKTSHHEVTSWSQPPAQRRTMPTAYPSTVDFSNIDAGHAFAALPAHILITHILSSRNLPDPSDLARLRAVSREMRDAVVATGRRVYELNAENAIHFGELSGMRLLHQRGDLDQRVDLNDGDEDYNDPNDDTFSLCTFAAKLGQLEVLKWSRENDLPWNERKSDEAACNGHLEVLQWARENGCPWDENTCWAAASGGQLEMLQWERANGCPWDEDTCDSAAYCGHLEVLQWAYANGCPWIEWTYAYAAMNGHLEMLQWARANGCPWNWLTCANAKAKGHFELLSWAKANGAPEA